jgi:hypothetical protein
MASVQGPVFKQRTVELPMPLARARRKRDYTSGGIYMAKVFRVLGIIGLVIIGLIFALPLLGALVSFKLGSFLRLLISFLIRSIIPMMLLALGSVMEQNDALMHKAYGTQSKPKDGMWICSNCGRSNADYVSICNCGNSRPATARIVLTEAQKMEAAQKKEAQNNAILAAGGWKCACGRANQAYISTCACGKGKSEAE